MERYELVEGASAKFWQFEVRGSELVVEYGRLGSRGQTNTKSFASPDAAKAAAAKLVKEKLGKGYRPVGAQAAPASQPSQPSQPEAPPASAASGAGATELPEGLTEAMLTDLAARLAKKSKQSPDELAERVAGSDDVGTWGRSAARSSAALAILFDRGLLPQKLVPQVLRELLFGWAFMRPATLLGLIRRPDFKPGWGEMALLRLGTADAALLSPEKDGALPPELARLAPLVRRRLGLSTEAIGDELADTLAADFVAGRGSVTAYERQGRCLVPRDFTSYDPYREYVVKTLGVADWDQRVVRAATANGFREAWRAEPLFLSAPAGELAGLLMRAGDLDSATLLRWLETRGDSAEALTEVAGAIDCGEPTWDNRNAHQAREAVAVVAGARLAAAGKPIPEKLLGCLWFIDNLPPTQPNPAYARALARWPREQVLARARELMQPSPVKYDFPLARPVRAAVALGAHPDAALTAQLLDGLEWSVLNDTAACIGRLGLDWLPDLVARRERAAFKGATWDLAIQTLLINAAEQSGTPFAAEHDVHFHPARCANKLAWERAVKLLPPARRDAYFTAWAKLDPFEHQPSLWLASDEPLDEVVGQMFSMREAESVHVTYPKEVSFSWVGQTLAACGPRLLPMIERHYRATGGDASARRLLAQTPLQPEVFAALAGTPEAPPPPAAAELDGNLTQRLTRLLGDLVEEASIKVPSGTLMVATGGHDAPRPLRRAAPKGSAKVLVHYDDDAQGTTAGLDALCLRFGAASVEKWEEVPKVLDSNVVGLVFGDEVAFDALADEDRAALDDLIQSKVAHGDAVATHEKKLVAAYIGEELVDHRVFWGLDAAGQPACLLASFASARG